MNDILPADILNALKGKLLKNASLAEYTSWRSGGPADYLYLPFDLEELTLVLKNLQATMPITCLGLGSNTLIRDGGVAGFVIVTQGGLNKITQINTQEIRAEAGVAAAQLARYTARLGLTGLEFLAGIPGTVGGALAMNAGCFGGETWQFVQSVEVITARGEILRKNSTEYSVGYRKVKQAACEWFVAGTFNLQRGDKSLALQAIRELLEKRNASQPTGTANCGSVFRNPQGNFAGKLIESCQLKGKQLGGAQVSIKHANFIINENKARSSDIENLISEVAAIVEQETGVRLIPEVCIIGRA